MSTATLNDGTKDVDLWELVCRGSVPAFEAIVRRHQSLVCAVAYNACGNLALSEDVAQETFWAAWQGRASLAEPERLRAWLCGIARNLGRNAQRRAASPSGRAQSLTEAEAVSTSTPSPVEAAVSREEESLVWQSLSEIPETYREPLILFYRQEQSTSEVAIALGLSEEAVRQRLSRGRNMLRERVADLVEGTLHRSRPGRNFTVAVVSGLTAVSAGVNTAAAAGSGVAASTVVASSMKAGIGGGMVGGVLGPVIGLLGGWLGMWVPAQMAPSKQERDYILKVGKRLLLVSILFTAVLLAGVLLTRLPLSPVAYLIFWAAWMLSFWAYIAVECVIASRHVRLLRGLPNAELDTNDAKLRHQVTAIASRYGGRTYRSRWTLLGLPLVDINVRDPNPGNQKLTADMVDGRGNARGWIAVGDDARGVLCAVGSKAVGLIAIGGRAAGVISFGGAAVGVIAFGGLAFGILGIGGLGLGIWALGGLAIGWQACGGGAIAWDMACAGGAVAWRAAYGGVAAAHDFAVGGAAFAAHANDEAAKEVLLSHPLKLGMDWYAAHVVWVSVAIVVISLVLPAAMTLMMYERRSKA